MTESEQSDLHKILTSQMRMEMKIETLSTAHHEHSDWTKRALLGDDSDSTPGLIKKVDRLDQTQQSVARWLGGVWALVLSAAGALFAWLLNQGTK